MRLAACGCSSCHAADVNRPRDSLHAHTAPAASALWQRLHPACRPHGRTLQTSIFDSWGSERRNSCSCFTVRPWYRRPTTTALDCSRPSSCCTVSSLRCREMAFCTCTQWAAGRRGQRRRERPGGRAAAHACHDMRGWVGWCMRARQQLQGGRRVSQRHASRPGGRWPPPTSPPAAPATARGPRPVHRTCKLPRRCCTARWAGRKAARCETAALALILLLRHLRRGFVGAAREECACRGCCAAPPPPGPPLTWARPPPRPSCCPLLDSWTTGVQFGGRAGPMGGVLPPPQPGTMWQHTAWAPKWAAPAPLALSQLAAWVEHSGWHHGEPQGHATCLGGARGARGPPGRASSLL